MHDHEGVALLVEREEAVATLAMRALEPRFGVVLTATRMADAMELLGSRPVDVAIIADPVEDGKASDLVSRIREARPAVLTVLAARLGPIELALEADCCDAAACLVKPFSEERLSWLLERLRPPRALALPKPNGDNRLQAARVARRSLRSPASRRT